MRKKTNLHIYNFRLFRPFSIYCTLFQLNFAHFRAFEYIKNNDEFSEKAKLKNFRSVAKTIAAKNNNVANLSLMATFAEKVHFLWWYLDIFKSRYFFEIWVQISFSKFRCLNCAILLKWKRLQRNFTLKGQIFGCLNMNHIWYQCFAWLFLMFSHVMRLNVLIYWKISLFMGKLMNKMSDKYAYFQFHIINMIYAWKWFWKKPTNFSIFSFSWNVLLFLYYIMILYYILQTNNYRFVEGKFNLRIINYSKKRISNWEGSVLDFVTTMAMLYAYYSASEQQRFESLIRISRDVSKQIPYSERPRFMVG